MVQPDVHIVEVGLQDGLRFEARDARGGSAILDAAPPTGAGDALSPLEFLLAGLGGCTAMDVIGILRKKRQRVTDYRVKVTGTRSSEPPKPYAEIEIGHIVTGHDVSSEAVRQAIELSEEKYCSVHKMLSQAAKITTTFEVRAEEPTGVVR